MSAIPTPTGHNMLAAIGAALLTVASDAAAADETEILSLFDGAVANGETNAAAALTTALKAKVPFVGAEIAATFSASLAGLDVTVDGAAKTAFDLAIADMKAEAAKLGTE